MKKKGDGKGQIPWNKGLTKETDNRIKLASEKISTSCLGRTSSMKGKHHTQESNQKNREKHLNKKQSSETIKKRKITMNSKYPLGYKHTPEAIKLIKEARKYQNPHTPEARLKMILAQLGKPSPMKGRHHTVEANQKNREKRLHRVFPKKDSKPEKMLQLALFINNIKFTTHKPIIGQPDIFIEPNICIFIDGDFWHANPDKYKNPNKIIRRNKTVGDVWAYDIKINHELNKLGYRVIRIWESDIKKDSNIIAKNILNLIRSMIII